MRGASDAVRRPREAFCIAAALWAADEGASRIPRKRQLSVLSLEQGFREAPQSGQAADG